METLREKLAAPNTHPTAPNMNKEFKFYYSWSNFFEGALFGLFMGWFGIGADSILVIAAMAVCGGCVTVLWKGLIESRKSRGPK
jgi:hypothetical protein